MQTQPQKATAAEQQDAEQKIRKLRELFADAPELGKKALENAMRGMASSSRARCGLSGQGDRLGGSEAMGLEKTGAAASPSSFRSRQNGLGEITEALGSLAIPQ